MAALNQTAMALRFSGEELDPAELTRLLGKTPTHASRTGDVVRSPTTGRERIEKTGGWQLQADDRKPGDLDAQVMEILSGLTDDLAVWRDLAARFRVDVFCGLFMHISDEGISLSPQTMMLLGERRITIEMCLYAPLQHPREPD